VSDALPIIRTVGDMAIDAVLIYAVCQLTYVVWRLQRGIRVGTSKLEHIFAEIETLRARVDALDKEALKQPAHATKGVRED
jgi:hypothetical protein